MKPHASLSVAFVVEETNTSLEPIFSYLKPISHFCYEAVPQVPEDLDVYDVVVTVHTATPFEASDRLTRFAEAGGGWLGLIQLSSWPLPDVFGAQPGPVGPVAELRVLFQNRTHPLATRLPDSAYLRGRYHPLSIRNEHAETVLYADWQYQHSPMLVYRPFGQGHVACTTLQDYANPLFQQIFYRLLRRLAGCSLKEKDLGVGILGYAPSVGKPHGLGIESTPGLTLEAACDLNPERLRQAKTDFRGLKTYESAEGLVQDPDIDLVIIATPPDSHARLSLQALEAGKHVICEKPLALTRNEADALEAMAERQKVHLSCHQNRRWDVDYLTIKRAVAVGRIGELFYLETFVGGFAHPCGYWHSHADVSGGTTFDWGGHYLDWIVSLVPTRVKEVIGTRHKRVWQDVTNADQERIQIRFTGGQEAEFMHSDIAAVRKPKWFLLGTEGAIVGLWQDVRTFTADPDLYFHQHDFPATEMPPDLTLYRRHPSGSIVPQKLAPAARLHFQFHRNLADHLQTGEPIAAPLKDSVRVVAILEAASRSASNGGRVEVLDV